MSVVQTSGVETEEGGCGILRISVVQTPVDDSGKVVMKLYVWQWFGRQELKASGMC